MSYIEEIISDLTAVNKILKDSISRLSPIYREEFGLLQDVTVPLFTSLHMTSESILILLENQAVFDADVLLRTVMEGTIKYCYLMTGNQEERTKKYFEYKTILPSANKVKDHWKAEEAIKKLKKFSSNDIRPFELSLLSDDELININEEFSRKFVKQVKGNWEFFSMLSDLIIYHPEYEAQLGMNYTYSLTSHFAHFDWESISMKKSAMIQAAHIDSPKADIAHALRIMSNILSLEMFRVLEFQRGNNFRDSTLAQFWMSNIKRTEAMDNKAQTILDTIFP